jgi:hypothetical protein
MSIFSGSDGRGCDGGVLRVGSGCPAPTIATIAVDTFSLQLPITGYSLDMGTNHQFLHSLDNFIYLYSFGDRIGELTLSGLAFTGSCVQNNGGNDISSEMGQCAILSYYKEFRVSGSAGKKVSMISLSNCPDILRGFLTGIRLARPEPAEPVVQWALRYHVIFIEDNVPTVSNFSRVPAATGPTGPAGSSYSPLPARRGTQPGPNRPTSASPPFIAGPDDPLPPGWTRRNGRLIPPPLITIPRGWPNLSWPKFGTLSPSPLPPGVIPPRGDL